MGIDFQKVTTAPAPNLVGGVRRQRGVTLVGVITQRAQSINTGQGRPDGLCAVGGLARLRGCLFPQRLAEYMKTGSRPAVIIKGAQTRDNETTTRFADILQPHVESYVTGADEPIFSTDTAFQRRARSTGTAFIGNEVHELSNGYDKMCRRPANPSRNDILD
ncbi:MAG: hypothetical protein H6643_05930 [Caldilineaceae bacterium]|nr:hypothetical protein [Caldilineaceae bacterium]